MAVAEATKTDAIRNLQRYLRRIEEDRGDINAVPIDGIFDTATRNALIRFQGDAGLAQTGVADKTTWDALYKEYLRSTELERGRNGLYFFPQNPIGYEVSTGDTLMLVRIIQLLLSELRATYDIFENVVESGTYDTETENAIRNFQRIQGLAPTGRVDERTWNRIVKEYSNL